MTEFTIKEATSAGAINAASLIYETDPGVWDYLFDGERQDFDAFAGALWESPGTSFSFDYGHEIVDASGQRLGLSVAYTGREEPALTRAVNPVSRGALNQGSLSGLLERAAWIGYLTPTIPDNDWYLHFLSVAPGQRGLGLGGKLLSHFLERASAAGARAAHLDVYVDNPAIGLYEAYGFQRIIETAFPNKPGLPRHYRMAKQLS